MSSTRAIVRAAAMAGLALALVGCETMREAAGVTKEPPDEFAVVTKSPLVVPPDFNLRPPKPGAVPTNQSSPTQAAQAALFGDDPVGTAATLSGSFSDEERIVLANSGGATADHSIRKQIVSDEKATEATDDSFTDALLFRSPDPDKGAPLDADAEAQRIQNAKANGQPVAGSSSATTPPAPQQQPKPDDSASIKKDGGGWFDGIF
jgi:hypothetical protein